MAHRFLSSATALALVLSAQSAAALTAEEAWSAVQAYATSDGQILSTESVTQDGDTLTVTGYEIATPGGQAVSVSAKMASMVFQDQGDGTVKITYAPSYDIRFSQSDATLNVPKSYTVTVTTDQLAVIASGSADAPMFDGSASEVMLTFSDVIGADGQPKDLTIEATLSDIAGKYQIKLTETGAVVGGPMTAGALDVTIRQSDETSSVNGTIAVSDLAFDGSTTSVDQSLMQAGDLAAMLEAGFAIESQMTSGPVTVDFDIIDNGTAGKINAALATTNLNVLLNADRMDYAIGMTGGAVSSTGFDMPLPEIASAFGEVAFGWSMPIQPSDEPQDYAFLLKLVDLTLTEDVWAIFDAGQQLPRDPVSFITDIKGTGAWSVNILDPAVHQDPGPGLPGKLFSMDLNQVLIRAAGAQVGAGGGLIFDNSRSYPEPTGTITVTLDGINAVLDALVGIGIVSPDDMMGARMGLAMFFRPGANPDQLVTDIEFSNGGIVVNGQQVF